MIAELEKKKCCCAGPNSSRAQLHKDLNTLKAIARQEVAEKVDKAITAAVTAITTKVQEMENSLSDLTSRISAFVEALQTLENEIREIEGSIPELVPYTVEEVSDAIDNSETSYIVNLTGIGTKERMLRDSAKDRKEDVEQPIYAWKTEDSGLSVFTYSPTPAVGDNVYHYDSGLLAGIVDSVHDAEHYE